MPVQNMPSGLGPSGIEMQVAQCCILPRDVLPQTMAMKLGPHGMALCHALQFCIRTVERGRIKTVQPCHTFGPGRLGGRHA